MNKQLDIKDYSTRMRLLIRWHLMQGTNRQAKLCCRYLKSPKYDAYTPQGNLMLTGIVTPLNYFRLCIWLYLSHLLGLTKLLVAKEVDFNDEDLVSFKKLGIQPVKGELKRYLSYSFYGNKLVAEMYHFEHEGHIRLIEVIGGPLNLWFKYMVLFTGLFILIAIFSLIYLLFF